MPFQGGCSVDSIPVGMRCVGHDFLEAGLVWMHRKESTQCADL